MSDQWRVTDQLFPGCLDCDATLTLVSSWPARGPWGYHEVRVYECATHGLVFVAPPSLGAEAELWGRPYTPPPDDGDRNARVPAHLKPAPALDADAIALPEPEPD